MSSLCPTSDISST